MLDGGGRRRAGWRVTLGRGRGACVSSVSGSGERPRCGRDPRGRRGNGTEPGALPAQISALQLLCLGFYESTVNDTSRSPQAVGALIKCFPKRRPSSLNKRPIGLLPYVTASQPIGSRGLAPPAPPDCALLRRHAMLIVFVFMPRQTSRFLQNAHEGGNETKSAGTREQRNRGLSMLARTHVRAQDLDRCPSTLQMDAQSPC